MESEIKTIAEQLQAIASEIYDNYCKYPGQPVPEGKTEDWLFDEDGPCSRCPFMRL